jgi:hypothetical protein
MMLGVIKLLVPACAALATIPLAACSSGPDNNGATPLALAPSSSATLPFGKSSKDILYVTDSGTNELITFAWPKPKSPTGTIVGPPSEPQGMCADQSGHAFVSNTGDENVLEYTGTTLTNTLTDGGQYPVDCSYDTSSGNLAVANILSTGDGAGTVALYRNAQGKPKLILGGPLHHVYALAYDGSGNLFAAGETSSYAVAFAELTAGSKKFKVICPNGFQGGEIAFPGGLAWDGKYIVVGNQDGDVYRIKGCKVVGTTVIGTGSSDIVYFTIAGNRLIAPDAGNADVDIFAYPKGGMPVQVLTGFSQPIGAAVSVSK